jgi:hypothetical protein
LAVETRPEDFGAIPNDGIDDAEAVQSAINEVLSSGGGKVIFPSGKLEIHNNIQILPNGYVGAEVKLQGNRGSIVEVSTGAGGIAFYAGNLNVFTVEDLIIVGKNVSAQDSEFYDAKYVIFSSYVQQTNIIRCQFYGLGVPNEGAIIYFGNTDGKVIDSQLDGNLGLYPNGAVVMAENTRGLTVSRTTFLDYANLHGEYLSKTPSYTGAWIKVKGGLPLNANGMRRVVIEDSRFDEGSAIAISIENVPWVYIAGNSVNVNGAQPGKGVYLNNIDHAKIEQCWFGYATTSRPALFLQNVKAVEVTSVKLSDNVYFWETQNVLSSSIKYCEDCF